MYKIGYIDDEKTQYENIRKKIKRYDDELDLCWVQGSNKIQEIVDEILRNQVDVLLIDYKMARAFGFNGAKLVSQMNDYISDMRCLILTQVDEKEITDGLVEKRDILSKSVFDTEGQDPQLVEKLKNVLNMLKDAAKVFRTRMIEKKAEYVALLNEQEAGKLKDENELKKLYQVLSSYGMVEKLPEGMLGKDVQTNLMNLIEMGQKIIQQYEGE